MLTFNTCAILRPAVSAKPPVATHFHSLSDSKKEINQLKMERKLTMEILDSDGKQRQVLLLPAILTVLV